MSVLAYFVLGGILIFLGAGCFRIFDSDTTPGLVIGIVILVIGSFLLVKGADKYALGNLAELKEGTVYAVTMIDPDYEWIKATVMTNAEDKARFYGLSQECAADVKANPGKMYSQLTVMDNQKCVWENLVPIIVPITSPPPQTEKK
jgi:hypothetical protein